MFPGFNRAKRGSISNGDWDRDGVKNKKDCEPLNFKKQGPGHTNIIKGEPEDRFEKRGMTEDEGLVMARAEARRGIERFDEERAERVKRRGW